MNETDIILPHGKIRRPDRVIIYPGSVDIIDYKSGSDFQQKEHERQVKEYIDLVSEMGYSNVNGYIWYITNNKIVQLHKDKS